MKIKIRNYDGDIIDGQFVMEEFYINDEKAKEFDIYRMILTFDSEKEKEDAV